jgi:hypothetical protein
MTLQTQLSRLPAAGRRFAAHNPERVVELRRLPERTPPLSFADAFADPAPSPGTHAYWVRVQQADGASAWSSPIFVTL